MLLYKEENNAVTKIFKYILSRLKMSKIQTRLSITKKSFWEKVKKI